MTHLAPASSRPAWAFHMTTQGARQEVSKLQCTSALYAAVYATFPLSHWPSPEPPVPPARGGTVAQSGENPVRALPAVTPQVSVQREHAAPTPKRPICTPQSCGTRARCPTRHAPGGWTLPPQGSQGTLPLPAPLNPRQAASIPRRSSQHPLLQFSYDHCPQSALEGRGRAERRKLGRLPGGRVIGGLTGQREGLDEDPLIKAPWPSWTLPVLCQLPSRVHPSPKAFNSQAYSSSPMA